MRKPAASAQVKMFPMQPGAPGPPPPLNPSLVTRPVDAANLTPHTSLPSTREQTQASPVPFVFQVQWNDGKPRTPILHAYSSSTEQMMARGYVQSYDKMDLSKASPKGGFPLLQPSHFIMPTSVRDVSSGPYYITSSAYQPQPFSKADLQSTLTTSLAPKSGMLPSQRSESGYNNHSEADGDLEKYSYSNPGRRLSGEISIPDTIVAEGPGVSSTPRTVTAPKDISSQIMGIKQPILVPTALGRPPSSARKVHSYVLPDGTVTSSGKGLGRGRPGIKRGPRKSKLSTEVRAEQPEMSLPSPLPTTFTPIISNKRKRVNSSSSENMDMNLSRSTSSTPEYTPQNTQTRSGRQTQKPTTFVPPSSPAPGALIVAGSPTTPVPLVARKPRTGSSTPNTNAVNPRPLLTHPKIKRRVYRGAAREQLALCEHCLRGNGPVGNAIVFCDACNRCWHQRCHEPRISKEVVSDTKKEWVCAECDAILRGGKKGKQAKKSSQPSSGAPVVVDATDRGAFNTASIPIGLVPGSALTRDQRVAFLSKLTKDRLIDLVLRASDLAPLLPLFEDPNPPPPPPPPRALVPHTPAAQDPTDEDEGFQSGEEVYEFYADEHVLLYPKPGHGIKLPPDSVDLPMLLEGSECKTFSHWVAPAGTVGGAGTADAAGAMHPSGSGQVTVR